jgi:putative membrane protein
MGIVMPIVFLALVTLAIILVIKAVKREGVGKGSDGSASVVESRALEILSERFARGEIDAETYRSMKKELEGV